MDSAANCPRCGAAVAVERMGHLQVDRCPKCHWEAAMTFFPADSPGMVEPEVVRVRLVWQGGRVTPKQALAARKIAPQLANQPLDAVLRECGDSATYDLGDLHEPLARDLQAKAEKLGLTVKLQKRADRE